MSRLTNLELVTETLALTNHYGLTAEVVLSCINIAKENPQLSVAAVLLNALDEWDCYPEALVRHKV